MKLLFPLLAICCLEAATAAEVLEADKRVVQTIQRLASFDYSKANEKTRAAINRYLDATGGTEEYFRLVEKFSIREQSATLLRLTAAHPGTATASQAVQLLLKLGQQEVLQKELLRLDVPSAGALLGSIAAVGSREAVTLVMERVVNPALDQELRVQAVKSLGMGVTGQQALLEAAKSKQLPEDLTATARTALTTSTDEKIRTEAATLFESEAPAQAPMASPAQLAAKKGDPEKGKTVYMTWCFTCHQVEGQGIDFGPALTEIGDKLPREALYDAVLNPSAGISFGYEGFEVKTAGGESYIGIVTGETPETLSMRLPGGVLQNLPAAEVSSKKPLGVSLMTPGLGTVIPETQLVDLIEYLTSLKKKP